MASTGTMTLKPRTRLVGGVHDRAMRRGAGHDHRIDAVILGYFEIGVEELVGSGLDIGLLAGRRHLGSVSAIVPPIT